jgi:hypothetical protein
MKRSVIGFAVAAVLAMALTAPTGAEARRGAAVAAGVIGGLSAGAIIAGAAYPYYGGYGYGYYPGYPAPAYDSGPAYLGPPPGCVIRGQRVWNGYAWAWRRIRVCH